MMPKMAKPNVFFGEGIYSINDENTSGIFFI